MKRTSRQLMDTAAEVLNDRVTNGGDEPQDLAGSVEIINEILMREAEGGRLVSAYESDGRLLGFVPRSSVPIPEAGQPTQAADDQP